MKQTFTKPFNSNAEILSLLQTRGLNVKNPEKAESYLSNIGYYRFSAYLYPFLSPPKAKGIFKPRSTFENARTLYAFDKKLRVLLFNEIEKVEVAFRSALANIAAEKLADKFWMTTPTSYANSARFARTMSLIDKEYAHSTEDFITHFKSKYTDSYPPAWMLVEILPLGVLTRIYANIADNSLRKKIAARFSLTVPVFESWLTVITLMRNACCHHARVWNKEHAITPMPPKKIHWPWLTTWPANRTYLNISVLKYFIDIVSPANDMKHHLLTLFAKYPNVDISAMGFPANWQSEPLWK